MRNFGLKIFWSFLFLFISLASDAQQPMFSASADASEIVTGGYVDVSFTLENAEGQNFKPPTFSGFRVISGPSRASQITIVNGRSSQKMSYTYTLLALKEGSYTIGSASIQVRNRRLASQPFEIKVVKGRPASGQIGEDGMPSPDMVFVKAIVSDSIAYLGQQVTLDYKLYTAVDIQSYDITSQPDFEGFYVESVKDYQNSFNREVIDGVQYRTRILKSFALFPQRTGTFHFEPMYLKLGVPFKDKNSRSFFFNTRVRSMPVVTNEISLEVRNLPDNPPPSFSGAVGKFSMQAGTKKSSISTDDALAITMNISGNGDGRKIEIPYFEFPEAFETYDPKMSRDENIAKSGGIINRKTFEYLAVPTEAGQYEVLPEFSYFDTDSLKYITLHSDPIFVNVKKGKRPRSKSHSFISDAAEMEMRPLKAVFRSGQSNHPWIGKKAIFALCGVFLALGMGIVGVKIWKSNQKDIDPNLLKKQNAQKLALEKLEQAKSKMVQDEERGFYEEISLAFNGYATDKLDLDTSEMSKATLAQKLKEISVDDQLVSEYIGILEDCEKVVYAGKGNTDMSDFYKKCLKLISDIEEEL